MIIRKTIGNIPNGLSSLKLEQFETEVIFFQASAQHNYFCFFFVPRPKIL